MSSVGPVCKRFCYSQQCRSKCVFLGRVPKMDLDFLSDFLLGTLLLIWLIGYEHRQVISWAVGCKSHTVVQSTSVFILKIMKQRMLQFVNTSTKCLKMTVKWQQKHYIILRTACSLTGTILINSLLFQYLLSVAEAQALVCVCACECVVVCVECFYSKVCVCVS